MPTYRNRCVLHGEWDAWQSIHDDTRPECRECGLVAQRVMVPPKISVYATPNKGADAKRIVEGDARLAQDLPAYRELRRQGYQPPKIDGCAVLQRDASDPIDIQMGVKAFEDPASYEKAREINQSLAESQREGEFATEMGRAIRGGA